MKFNPVTKTIYTADKKLIKQMNCPYAIQWQNTVPEATDRHGCNMCNNIIFDTKYFTADELMELVKTNENACFKVDLGQHNLKII